MPATIFLVTDHLDHLLVKNYMRRDKDPAGERAGPPRYWAAARRCCCRCCAANSCLLPLLPAVAACLPLPLLPRLSPPLTAAARRAPNPPPADKAAAPGAELERFDRAVRRLHAGIFQGYTDWCAHVEVPQRRHDLDLPFLKTMGLFAVRLLAWGAPGQSVLGPSQAAAR